MKSVREIYKEISSSEELQAGLKAAQSSSTVGDFLIGLGCANINEIMLDYYRMGSRKQVLDMDELDSVVGGTGKYNAIRGEADMESDLDKLSDAQLLSKLFNQVL